MKRDYKSKAEILSKAKEAVGKSFDKYDIAKRLDNSRNKGGLGQVIEEGLFGYEINSIAEADFADVGIELKVTPIVKNKNGTYSAKERLVLNIINYCEEYLKTFETSSFWKKNQSLLLMFYLYLPKIPRRHFEIRESLLFEYPEEDLKIIQDDWEHIVSIIRKGEAHKLSEADTQYLGACTKGKDKTSQREQPFSRKTARQRAFSLKQSYMTNVVRRYVVGNEKNEKVIKNINELKGCTFEEYILDKLNSFSGMKQVELCDRFGLNIKAKNINDIITSRMLGCDGKISNTEEFLKANIKVKTIRVDNDGKNIREHMSFPTFSFTELLNEQWDTSELRAQFEETKWLFVVYKFDAGGSLCYLKSFFWNMPQEEIDNELKEVWLATRKVIKEGVVLRREGRKTFNNLPSASDSRVAHVRPHAQKASYEPGNPNANPLPDGRWMTKQSFWLNRSYILEQINNA